MKAVFSHLPSDEPGDRPTRNVLSWLSARLPYHYASIFLVILPLILLLPGLDGFPYPPGNGAYSDLAISHYPYTLILQRSLLSGQGLPLWTTAIFSGQPLVANPLAGVWYPPGWLALLLPLPLGLNLVAALHLGWGGLGMYLLLRSEGLGQPGSLFGGLAVALLPKLYAHFGAGHLTLIYAASWTPWLLASTRVGKAARDPGRSRLITLVNWNYKPAIVLALIFLADPRWSIYAGLLWLAYQYFQYFSTVHKASHLPFLFRDNLFTLGLVAFLAAPLALPLWEFTRLSTRAGLSPVDRLSFSLPPARLLGLFFPALGGFHEWMLYPGALVLLMAGLAFMAPSPSAGAVRGIELNSSDRQRLPSRVLMWSVVLILSLLLSFGSYLPPLQALFNAPVINLLRVPSRALFITGLSLVALASGSIDYLLNDQDTRLAQKGVLLLEALACFTFLFTIGIWKILGKLPLNFAWGSLGFMLGSLWIGLRLKKRVSPTAWLTGLAFLCAVDLLFVDRSLFIYRPADQALAEAHEVVAYLKAQPGPFRVYSPSYSLPQQSAAPAGLELADGIDPLQLERYVDFMDWATGVPRSGYSVTLPPYENGDPDGDNASYTPDAHALGLLNVRFLTSEYDLKVPGLVLRTQVGQTRVYENLRVKPRAWLQPGSAAPGEEISPVNKILRTPNRIEVEAHVHGSTPLLLVLSEVFYPGWTATVDGKKGNIRPVSGLLRAVSLEPGIHQVVFVFRPMSLVWGVILGCLGLLFILFTCFQSRHYQKLYSKRAD